MENKYLISDPVNWLLEQTDSCVRFLTRRDILNCADNDDYTALLDDPSITWMLAKCNNGILGDNNNFDIYYRGTMWFFAEAVARGLDSRTYHIAQTGRYIIEHFQLPTGGFTLQWDPPTADACRSGDMLRYLILAGIEHEGIEKGITWILDNQRHDGGWLHSPVAGLCDYMKLILLNKAGMGLKREKNSAIKSCPFATMACSLALCAYKENYDDNNIIHAITKAALFMLDNHDAGHYPNTRLLGYPVLQQYDMLLKMIFLAQAGLSNDARAGDIFNYIMTQQNIDGTWNLENVATGMLFGNKKALVGKPSKWVTLNVLRMLKYAGLLH